MEETADTKQSIEEIEIKKGKSLDEIPNSYTIIDLETTGVNPRKNHIIEVGCIKIRNGQEIARYESLIKVPNKLSSRVKKMTGITDDMLIEAPEFKDIAQDLWNFLKDEIIVGHNVYFDIQFIYVYFYKEMGMIFGNDYVDTLKICRRNFPSFKSYSLENICNELNISADHHRAISDCLIVRDILNESQSQMYEIIEEKSMAINLVKGQKIDLTKNNPELKNILVGLGWSLSSDANAFDLDASAFLLGVDGKVTNERDFVFYNNLKDSSGAVEHLGDNLVGGDVGDNEQIIVDLSKLPPHVDKIAFTITIYESEERQQNFGMIKQSFIRVVDYDNNKELIHYDLEKDFSVETAIIVAEIYKHSGLWKFQAIGSGFRGGLAALGRNFGVKTENKTDQITISVYPNVKSDVKKLAAMHKTNMSAIVNKALQEYIDKYSEEIKRYDNFMKNIKQQ